MNKRTLRAVILSALAIATVLGAASPATANHTGFSKTEYEVGESDGYVELTAESTFCCPTGSGQFDYHTENLSAIAGADYEETSGTITTAGFCEQVPGERASCKIRVPIISDEEYESEEQFLVRLTNFRGTYTFNEGPTTAVVKILDNDPKPPANSTSTRSSRQTSSASTGSSPLRSPAPHPSGAGQLPDEDTAGLPETPASGDGLVIANETHTREDGDQLAAQGRREVERSSLPFVALGTLLITGLGVLLWFRSKRSAPA